MSGCACGPGTDGALALGLANLMIQNGWYDRDFIRDWSNGPLLVRADTGRLLSAHDLGPRATRRYFAWHEAEARPVAYDAAAGSYEADASSLALEGEYRIATPHGEVVCRPAFELYAALCRQLSAGSRRGDLLDSARAARSEPRG